MREASAVHLKRARDLEAQEQLPGAAAEYRLAASLDTANSFALSKAMQIEKTLREQAEANRPLSRIEEMRQQAAQASTIPRLDPRTRVNMSFSRAAVQAILNSIAQLSDITVTYDANLSTALNNSYTVTFTDTPIEEAFTTVLSANTMTFKITGPKSIFVYQDSATNRQRYEDLFFQMFYLSHADPQEIMGILQQMTQATQLANRPVIQPIKTANALSVRATAPLLGVIGTMIERMDKPRAEVIIEVEILEVNRGRVKDLGIDLTQYAIGLQFSPEVAPGGTTGAIPPATPPPYNLNTVSRGVSTNDFYVTTPAAVLNMLESDAKTRLLANPQLRGREGFPMTLNLGDQIPIIQTQLLAGAAGGVPTVPQQSIQYRNIGVNLTLTPRVTYQDEIIIDSMTVNRSGLGGEINVGGNNYQTFVDRQAIVNLRLRNGESSLLAGLIRDEDRKTWASIPGILHIPFFRNLFGHSTTNH
jgi:general secretion pathway protein D